MVTAHFDKSVQRARDEITKAEDKFMRILKAAYPINSRVRVITARSSFYGIVTGHHLYGHAVEVCNEITHKKSKWWFVSVERA